MCWQYFFLSKCVCKQRVFFEEYFSPFYELIVDLQPSAFSQRGPNCVSSCVQPAKRQICLMFFTLSDFFLRAHFSLFTPKTMLVRRGFGKLVTNKNSSIDFLNPIFSRLFIIESLTYGQADFLNELKIVHAITSTAIRPQVVMI